MIPGMTQSMTKKIGVKGTCTLLATFLFLSVGPSLVMAQVTGSVCFYKTRSACEGISTCCDNIPSNGCCINTRSPDYGFSAVVTPPSEYDMAWIFVDFNCTTWLPFTLGTSCFIGEYLWKFNSGKWISIFVHDGAEPGSEKPCNETVSTDTLQYTFITEDRRRASWVLPMASLTEADSNGPLHDLPAVEQVIWFKSRGATLKVEDHQTMPVPDYNAYSPAAGL